MLFANLAGQGVPTSLMAHRLSLQADRLLGQCNAPADAARHLDDFLRHADTSAGMASIWAEYAAPERRLTWCASHHAAPLLIDPDNKRVRSLAIDDETMPASATNGEHTCILRPGQWVLFHSITFIPGFFDEAKLIEFIDWHLQSTPGPDALLAILMDKILRTNNYRITNELLMVFWEIVE